MDDSDVLRHFDKVLKTYHGDAALFERAVGAFVLGRKVGWKPLLLMHDRKVLKRYADILGIDFQIELPDVGPLAEKSLGWRLSLKVSSFWKAVKGEIPNVKSAQLEIMRK